MQHAREGGQKRSPQTVNAAATVAFGMVLGIGATLARLPRTTWDTLYAEDGQVFLQGWMTDPSLLLLITPYDGYLHLWPRLVSGLVSALPVETWPTAMTVGVGASVGAIGALSMIASKQVVSSPMLRILVLLTPILLPFAGIEALGNLANIHWYFLYLGFWTVWHTPASRKSAAAWGILLAVSAMTEIQMVLLLPLVAARAWKGTHNVRIVLAGWAFGCAAQTAGYLSSDTTRTDRGIGDPAAMLRGLLLNVVMGTPIGHQPRVNWIVETSGWAIPGALCVILTVLLTVSTMRSPRHGKVMASAVFVSIATWGFSFLLNNYPELDYAHTPFPLVRWGTGASLLLWAALITAADAVSVTGPTAQRIVPALAMGALVLCAVASPATVNARHGAPSWSEQLSLARTECTNPHHGAAPVMMRHAPEGWAIAVSCGRLR